MTNLFAIGACILMNGYYYQVVDVTPGVGNSNRSYLLSQTVTVFEEDRTFTEYWKVSYIDKIAKDVNKPKWRRCQ